MEEPLRQADDALLAERVEANAVDCCWRWTEWPGMDSGREPGYCWTLTDVPFAFFNNLFLPKFAADEVAPAISQAMERAAARDVPIFCWTGHTTRPADFAARVVQLGFVPCFTAPAMVADLTQPVEQRPLPEDCVVEEVTDPGTLAQWCDVMTTVYEFPADGVAPWRAIMAHLGVGKDRSLRHFLARSAGEVVATASLCMSHGVAGISSVGTLAPYRRRGLGRGVTIAAMQAAAEQGYRYACLFSSPDGLAIYQSLGFRTVGEGACFLWPAPAVDDTLTMMAPHRDPPTP